jgi:hypothetical protein
MAVVEYSRQSWFDRLGNAIKGIVFGGILFLVSFPLLIWNEGRAVHTARMLEEGASNVVPVDSASISPGNEGKLVHFTGNAATTDKLTDAQFGVTQDAIHLKRVVLMYQWKEKKTEDTHTDTVGGGATKKTTYSYDKVWEEKPIDSSGFQDKKGHSNPDSMRFSGKTLDASNVTVGAFSLPADLIEKIDNYGPVVADKDTVAALPSDIRDDAAASDGSLYFANETGGKPDPADPKIGDLKVTFTSAPPGPVSVIARQTSSTLSAYPTQNGALQLLYTGTHSADEMFKAEQSKNTTLTWILRAGGFLAMWIGMMLVLNPLKVMADVIGILGDIAGAGIGLITFFIAVGLSLATVAIAWIAFRPVVGIGLLVAAVAAFVGVIVLKKRGAANRAARGGPPPMPA